MTFRNDERSGIAILADDLTSAGDGAAPFRRAGHDARILLSTPPAVPQHAMGVTAVDLGSRVLDEEAASFVYLAGGAPVRRLRAAHQDGGFHPARPCRGRGPGGMGGIAEAGRHHRPGLPGGGQGDVEGVQYVRGVPVHESDLPATRYTPCGARTSPRCSRRPFWQGRARWRSCPN